MGHSRFPRICVEVISTNSGLCTEDFNRRSCTVLTFDGLFLVVVADWFCTFNQALLYMSINAAAGEGRELVSFFLGLLRSDLALLIFMSYSINSTVSHMN